MKKHELYAFCIPRHCLVWTPLRYEGRWEMGQKSDKTKARSLEEWVEANRRAELIARPPARLWSCVSNYYVKVKAVFSLIKHVKTYRHPFFD